MQLQTCGCMLTMAYMLRCGGEVICLALRPGRCKRYAENVQVRGNYGGEMLWRGKYKHAG